MEDEFGSGGVVIGICVVGEVECMKRWEGEDFEDYKARRASNKSWEAAHLRGKVGGRYVDGVLHRTVADEVRSDKMARQNWAIGILILTGILGFLVGTLLYPVLFNW